MTQKQLGHHSIKLQTWPLIILQIAIIEVESNIIYAICRVTYP